MCKVEPESYQKRPGVVESRASTGSGEDLGTGERDEADEQPAADEMDHLCSYNHHHTNKDRSQYFL